jgi:hypothetical protein
MEKEKKKQSARERKKSSGGGEAARTKSFLLTVLREYDPTQHRTEREGQDIGAGCMHTHRSRMQSFTAEEPPHVFLATRRRDELRDPAPTSDLNKE